MTVKHQPGTKLPWWPRENTDGQMIVAAMNDKGGFAFPLEAPYDAPHGKQDVLYAVHAAVAYPKLVEALRALTMGRGSEPYIVAENSIDDRKAARALLLELGEAE